MHYSEKAVHSLSANKRGNGRGQEHHSQDNASLVFQLIQDALNKIGASSNKQIYWKVRAVLLERTL